MTIKQRKCVHLNTHFWNMHELFNTRTHTYEQKKRRFLRICLKLKEIKISTQIN
jgi:hypothetical protein